MIFHQIDFSGELQDILSRLKEEEDRLADQILRLDVSPREMPPEGREELAAALALGIIAMTTLTRMTMVAVRYVKGHKIHSVFH